MCNSGSIIDSVVIISLIFAIFYIGVMNLNSDSPELHETQYPTRSQRIPEVQSHPKKEILVNNIRQCRQEGKLLVCEIQ